LKSVKGDTDREQNLEKGDSDVKSQDRQQGLHVIDEEIVILEEAEDRQISGDAEKQEEFPFFYIFRFVDLETAEIIENRGGKNKGEKPPVPGTVKHVTGHQQHPVLQPMVENEIETVNYGEKYKEFQTVE